MNKDSCALDELLIGTATVGERGQIVIPSEARQLLNINPGDKLMLLRHPQDWGLVLCKLSSMREFIDQLQNEVKKLETHVTEDKK